MNVPDTLMIANAVGVGIVMFLLGANASADRARRILGNRIERYGEIDDADLSRAVRATYWGPEGIAWVAFVALFFRGIGWYGTLARGMAWGSFIAITVCILLAAGMFGLLQTALFRGGITRRLDRWS